MLSSSVSLKLSLTKVASLLGVSRSTIYRRMNTKTTPRTTLRYEISLSTTVRNIHYGLLRYEISLSTTVRNIHYGLLRYEISLSTTVRNSVI